MVNAQADALVRSERRDKPEWSLIYYEERMVLCDSQEAITMPGSAPATTTIQQPLNDAQMLAAWLLSIKGAHNWDCTGVIRFISRSRCAAHQCNPQLW